MLLRIVYPAQLSAKHACYQLIFVFLVLKIFILIPLLMNVCLVYPPVLPVMIQQCVYHVYRILYFFLVSVKLVILSVWLVKHNPIFVIVVEVTDCWIHSNTLAHVLPLNIIYKTKNCVKVALLTAQLVTLFLAVLLAFIIE